MIKIIKFLPILIFTFLFFRFFASSNPFVAHDFPLLFRESRDFFPFWSLAWDYMGSGGIGGAAFKTLWIDLYANFVYFISNSANIPWWLSQRIFWLVPFLALSLFSSYKFSGLFIKDSVFRVLSSIIYTFNTYILLIVGGGQFGIAFAYALSPLALFYLIKLFKNTDQKSALVSGLFSGVLIAMDPRVSLLIFVIAAVWYLFFVRSFSPRKLFYIFGSLILAVLLNSYWVLPAGLFFLTNSASSTISSYTSLPGVKFLSFATLENSISFLHPNWPENIFGKIYFQRPEFLVLPILAFATLLFKVKKEVLFLVVLGLLGAFLAKGANDPFGGIYLFLFKSLPGFNLFRDPTKFYILIAISYTILIPFFLESMSLKFKKYKTSIVLVLLVYLLFVLRAGWSGELTGIFKPKEIPEEYVRLNTDLRYSSQKNETEFSRVLWVPKRQKYGYFDPSVPAADSEVLFKGRDLEKISEDELYKLSIKYIIVPTDPDGEIFLTDRKYDNALRERTIKRVEKIPNLQGNRDSGQIKVYETYSSSEHFYMVSGGGYVNYSFINPTKYSVRVYDVNSGDRLVFSEGFDKNWIAEDLASQGLTLHAQKFKNNLNSFVLPKDGDYELKVYYEPQKWVNIGLVISGLTLLNLILGFLVIYYRHGRNTRKN